MYDVVSVYGLAVVFSVRCFYFSNIWLINYCDNIECINVCIMLMQWSHLARNLVDTDHCDCVNHL